MVQQTSVKSGFELDTSTVSIILVCGVGLITAWVMGSRAKAHRAAVAAANTPDYGALAESAGYDTSQSGSSGLPYNLTIAKSPLLGTPLPITGNIDPRQGGGTWWTPPVTNPIQTAPIPGGHPVTNPIQTDPIG